MLINREAILAKVEVTYGTDSVPAPATDAVLVENINWSNEGLRMTNRPSVRASLGELQHIYGGMLRSLTFDVELKGAGGAVDVPPEVGVLLRGCGFDETINAMTSVVYAPVSTGHESLSIYYYQDGKRTIMTGCRGNVSFNLETGMPGKMSFTFIGHVANATDVALPAPTYDTVAPPPVLGNAFAVGGFAATINALTFDLTNTVSQPPDMSASDGYAEIRITKRDINGSYDPEAELVATEDPEADLRSGAILALDTGVIGSAVGNRIQLNFPQVVYRDQSPGDREGIRVYEIPFGARETTADDELSITFT